MKYSPSFGTSKPLATLLLFLFFLMGGAFACSDSDGVQPELDSLSLAKIKPDADDPSVTETDPPEAPQDTTLQVLILGEGFDRGTTVEFGDEGEDGVFTPDSKVKATHVRYVNAKRLDAEVTVAIDADLRLYDVAVRTSRGKKGIGTELFRVIEKITGPVLDLEIVDFHVDRLSAAPTEAGDRCPDPSNPCNRLVLTYTGDVDEISFWAYPVIEDLYFDPDLVDSHRAVGAARRVSENPVVPPVRHATSPATLITYWQGQWTPRYWETDMGPAWYLPVEPVVDLDPIGETDSFIFMFSYLNARGGRMWSHPFKRFGESAVAVFQGPPPMRWAYLDIAEVVADAPKPKNKPARLGMTVRAFSGDVLPGELIPLSVVTHVAMRTPDGGHLMLDKLQSGEKNVFRSDELTASGCYQAEVVTLDILPGVAERVDDRLIVWDRNHPLGDDPVLGIEYDASSRSILEVRPGGCGS